MDMYFYAQLDENKKCFAVSQLSGEVINVNLIRIDAFDETLMGKLYVDGEWVAPAEPEQERPGIAPVTNEEVIQATMEVRAMMDVLMDQGALPEKARVGGKKDRHLPRYEFWRKSYFRNHANANTLQQLAEGGVLTQKEVDGIVADRIAELGV